MTDAADAPRLAFWRAAPVGVLALAAALGAGHLVAAFVGPTASPLLAVGNSVIDLSPEWLVQFAKDAFGTANKLVLFVGMAVVLLGVAVLAGWLSRRRLLPGLIVVVVLGVVGIAAVLTRPDLGMLGALAPVASLLVGSTAFGWLHGRAMAAELEVGEGSDDGNVQLTQPEGATRATPMVDSRDGNGGLARRRLLVGGAGVLVGAGVAGGVGQWLAGPDVEASRRAVAGFGALQRARAIPRGADFARAGTPTLITSNEDFYTIHTAFSVPRLRAEDWQLRIHGMVDRPFTLTYAELRERPLVERTLTLACVSNPVGGDLISTANFVGVDLPELLAEVGIRDGAEQLFSTSHDGFTAGTPIDVVQETDRGSMLAIGMNGVPLPVNHGFPVRMIVPGLYGFVSATKWLVDLEVTTWKARTPYWLPRGWAREAPVKTQSRIDAPDDGATVRPGKVTVAGTAWAPHIGIDVVEVRVDEGPWQRAELATEVSTDTWRMWRAEVDVPAGEHRISCRATDRTGHTQTADVAAVAPDGATGWHSVAITAS
jgi:DMSO/TMAO reductase YedYZ molybdopterin-dependent catalytic subunit